MILNLDGNLLSNVSVMSKSQMSSAKKVFDLAQMGVAQSFFGIVSNN